MNREEIMKVIPHRGKMLLLDEAYEGGGSYKIKGDEFFLDGHFPGNPVVPGVILCEIMAQSACLTLKEEIKGGTPYFTGMDKVRIRKSVLPNDTFTTKITVKAVKAPFYFIYAEGYVGESLCISGELSFAVKNE